MIETLPNRYAERPFRVEYEHPEFTSICPLTGAPDFGTLTIRYVPKEKLLELKSLRDYLAAFRARPILQEEVVNEVLDEVVEERRAALRRGRGRVQRPRRDVHASRGSRRRPGGGGVDLGLQGRTAIVCGASAGMGLAIAEALAEEGANVAMFARRRELLEREAERIGALAVRGDVTNPADLKRLVSRTVEAFGGVDILVNNCGGPPRGPAVGLTDARLREPRSSCCCSRWSG